ncbi:hypothetical protein PIB30_009568 [Stylosanthes scabra]|uniref:Uncharacterized protein n=1 Tax=Stylosanthes scabra TaxID=79078 RepID=A0ABU6Q610_9FABA|nr:hypothetical protein [Stylosanthes scabra]
MPPSEAYPRLPDVGSQKEVSPLLVLVLTYLVSTLCICLRFHPSSIHSLNFLLKIFSKESSLAHVCDVNFGFEASKGRTSSGLVFLGFVITWFCILVLKFALVFFSTFFSYYCYYIFFNL